VIRFDYGESDAYPAVTFPLKGLTVVAFQYQDSLLSDAGYQIGARRSPRE